MQASYQLVICITSTALFDCSKSHKIWQRDGLEAYKKYQHEHAKIPLKPGVGFPLVHSLLELNKVVNQPLVDIVLVSRNNAEAGQPIIDSINHYELSIKRMSFTCGADVTRYLQAYRCDLFLSTEESQVRNVLAGVTPDPFEGIAAGLVCNMIHELVPVQPTSTSPHTSNFDCDTPCIPSGTASWPKDQVRIVFDGDGVIFLDEPKSTASKQSEQEMGNTSLAKGPMQAFALKLQNLRGALGETNGWRIRTFLLTGSTDASAKRVLSTLKEWGLDIDETHILSGLDKTTFLHAMDPAIFFDHSNEHSERTDQYIPAAYVPYSPRLSRASIDEVLLTIPDHVPTSSIFLEDDLDVEHLKNY